jgi:hypothetical protein
MVLQNISVYFRHNLNFSEEWLSPSNLLCVELKILRGDPRLDGKMM